MYFLSALHTDPLSKVHLSSFASCFISALSSPFGCFHLCEISSDHLLPFTCTSYCILTIASVLLCGPSAAALTHRQFCPRINTMKSHFPNFPKVCLALVCLSLLLLFSLLSASLHSHHIQTYDEPFELPPPYPFCFSFSTSLPSAVLDLGTFPRGLVFSLAVFFERPWALTLG